MKRKGKIFSLFQETNNLEKKDMWQAYACVCACVHVCVLVDQNGDKRNFNF